MTPQERAARRRETRRRRHPGIVAEARRALARKFEPPASYDAQVCQLEVEGRMLGDPKVRRQLCGVWVQGGADGMLEHIRTVHDGQGSR